MLLKLLSFLPLLGLCLANPVQFDLAPNAKCGLPVVRPDTTSNIIGGKDAIPYSWPWQAVLCVKGPGGRCNLRCGGTLISNQWIMTAGHCFAPTDQPGQFSFKLGVFNQQTDGENGELIVDITEFHIHPQFNQDDVPVYDISLAKLKTPVQFTDHISPVCLPKLNENLPNPGTPIFLTGWGRTINSNQAPVAPTLKQVSVPMVSKQNCQNFLFGQDYSTVIFCVGFPQGGKSACNGDSGGPAVYQDATNNNQWTQIGITSFGLGSREKPCSGVYSAYSRVSTYIEFIQQYVKDL